MPPMPTLPPLPPSDEFIRAIRHDERERVQREERASKIVDVSINNIYPALKELAEEGLVSYRQVEQEARPNK